MTDKRVWIWMSGELEGVGGGRTIYYNIKYEKKFKKEKRIRQWSLWYSEYFLQLCHLFLFLWVILWVV